MTGEKWDVFFDSLLKLPALKELVLDCEIHQDTLQTLEMGGVYWSKYIKRT